jgi:hypothetical protein
MRELGTYADEDQISPGSHLDDFGHESGPDMPYTVINLDTDESHGDFETLSEARGCVRYDRLRAYAIWHKNVRVECCEPYDGDDDRAKQGLGIPNASER